MDPIEAWNSLGWIDGILFTVWLGVLYTGKRYIDRWFDNDG